jgi:hypothetical protein
MGRKIIPRSGNITFACGATPVTIVITQPGGLIIPGGSLTLKNLSVAKGLSLSGDGRASVKMRERPNLGV